MEFANETLEKSAYQKDRIMNTYGIGSLEDQAERTNTVLNLITGILNGCFVVSTIILIYLIATILFVAFGG